MSRCFPFPPPGYEKKLRSDDIDLLAKEKCREKKNTKEKRDKEKREDKEKKDKDRSRDKNKQKKDRKEKHKEKKRDKDRVKEKRLADDNKIKERTKGHNEEKLGDGNQKTEEVKNSKFIEEFGRRIKDEGSADRLLENFVGSVQKGAKGFGAPIALEKERGNRNEMAANLIVQEVRRNDALRQSMEMDADKKIEGKEGAKHRYEMFATLVSKEQRRNDGLGRAVEKDTEKNVEAKEKAKDRYGMVANLFCKEQGKDDWMGQPVEKDAEQKIERKEKAKDDAGKKIEGKEKVADREANVRKGDMNKDGYWEKRRKGKDKDRHKEKGKEKEKTREKSDIKHKECDMQKDSGKKDQLDNLIMMLLTPQKDDERCAGTDGTIKKRKDFGLNGFLQEIDGLPHKLSKPAPSSHPHVENGRTFESCHVATGYSSIKHGTTNNINAERVLDNKARKITGIVGPLPSTSDLGPLVSVEASPDDKASVEPPHPDTKFLSQIYSVPKMEEWPEYDEQDWLFSSDPSWPKAKATFRAEETPQAWAEGLQIESADVFALPYVIPY